MMLLATIVIAISFLILRRVGETLSDSVSRRIPSEEKSKAHARIKTRGNPITRKVTMVLNTQPGALKLKSMMSAT